MVKEWAKRNNVEQIFAVPHYHQSNGRIERANRTIRTACKKTEGATRRKLKNIVDNYNSLYHRALGMSPNEACMPENLVRVRERQEKYSKEFEKLNKNKSENFRIGDKVLIRNEAKENKMDYEFMEIVTIESVESRNIYAVKKEMGNVVRRHVSQLKKF